MKFYPISISFLIVVPFEWIKEQIISFNRDFSCNIRLLCCIFLKKIDFCCCRLSKFVQPKKKKDSKWKEMFESVWWEICVTRQIQVYVEYENLLCIFIFDDRSSGGFILWSCFEWRCAKNYKPRTYFMVKIESG